MKIKNENWYQKNTLELKYLAIVLLLLTLIPLQRFYVSTPKTFNDRISGVTPDGEYSVGNSYSYFKSNGIVSFYNKRKSGHKNCNTGGNWKKEGKYIYVSGLYNSNCPFMSNFNGKYLIDKRRALPR